MTMINEMETHERRSVDYSFGLLREFSVSKEETAMGFSFSAMASRKTPSVVSTLCGVGGDVSGAVSAASGVVPCVSSGVVPCASGSLPYVGSGSQFMDNGSPCMNNNSSPFVNITSSPCIPNTAPINTLPTVNTSQSIDALLRERLEGLRKEECRKRRQKRREILRIKRQKGLVSFDCPVRYRQRSEQANQRLRSSGRFVSELQYIDA